MDMITAAIAAKMTGVPKPTPAEAGKVPLANANGGYTLTDLGPGISYEVVSELPSTGEAGVIYLVANGAQSGTNIYDEYIWTGSGYEKIGTTETAPQIAFFDNFISNDPNVDDEAVALQMIAAAQAGKLVIGRLSTGIISGNGYILQSYICSHDVIFLLLTHVQTASSVTPLGAITLDVITYNSQTHRFNRPTFSTQGVRLVVNTIPDEGLYNYREVVQRSSNGFLYVQRGNEVPDASSSSDIGKVLLVSNNNGSPLVEWGRIKTETLTWDAGDLYNAILGAISVSEASSSPVTWGASGAGAYQTAAAYLNFFGVTQAVTGETPYVNFGNYRGRVTGISDNGLSIEVSGFDSTNNYFAKISMVAEVDTSGGEGNETGAFMIHVETFPISAVPSA